MCKRLFSCLLAFLFAFTAPSIMTKAEEAGEQWYIRHTDNHTAPSCDARLTDLNQYGAYYLGPEGLPNSNEKKLYITFDLGYVNENVIKIMDVLRDKGVHAAFFILDHVADKNADILKQLEEDGHLICNHTANHIDVSKATKEQFLKEITAMEQSYTEATGNRLSMFFRPPEGKFSKDSLIWAKEAGYITVFWSFAYSDWDNQKQPDPAFAKKKILKHTHPREILLLHPTSKTNADILGDLIDIWQEEGYSFGSLNDLILRTIE